MSRNLQPLLYLAVALSFSACNCGGGGTDPGDGGVDSGVDSGVDGGEVADAGDLSKLRLLELTPAAVTLTARNDTPAVQAYTVLGRYSDDSTRDLTASTRFTLDDPRLGGFSGPQFTSTTTVGGSTIVRATVGDLSAEATLTVVLSKQILDPNPGSGTLPGNPDTMFGGAPAGDRKPQLVYPNDGVLVPPNLERLEFHFRKGHASNTLFELALTNGTTDVRIYLRCYMPTGVPQPSGITDGCIYSPAPAVWSYLAETNRGAEPLQVRLRATDDSGTGPVGESEPLSVSIARSELKGALYYWTTSQGTGVMRYDFAGPPTATPEKILGTANANGKCVGCHALSRDGKKLVASAGGSGAAEVLLYDLSTNQPLVPFNSTPKSAFNTWSPDGTAFAGVWNWNGINTPGGSYGVNLFNGQTAQPTGSIPGTGSSDHPATHPDWSPDGNRIVYVRQGTNTSNQTQNFGKGSIQSVSRDGTGWTAPVTVVGETAGKNRYYPAVAPDSTFLVYNESTCASGSETGGACDSDTDPSAKLWTARLVANAPRVELARANARGVLDANTNLTNSYPKWSPFEVRGSDGPDSRLNWLTFSSSRRYGLRTVSSGTRLWMAAVDPDRVALDEDGSFPAFALPFQDLTTSNHIAQWAQYAVIDGCATEGDGCHSGAGGSACCNGLSCTSLSTDPPLPCDREGNCVCREKNTCAITGESCSASTPCCGTLACENAVGGGACTGDDCVCQPACGAVGQACGGGNGACCGGLLCLSPVGGACSGDNCACRIGID